MRRRTLLGWFAALFAVRPLSGLRIFAQAVQPPPPFSAAEKSALVAMADVALPQSIGEIARADAVNRFVSWFVNYRPDALRGGGYGDAQLGRALGPPPIARYPEQFAALDHAAQAQGAASFAALAADKRRVVLEAALDGPPRVNALPQRPNGASLVADFMGFYFASDEAHDLCYQAQIQRHECRGLPGSDKAPAPLTRRGFTPAPRPSGGPELEA